MDINLRITDMAGASPEHSLVIVNLHNNIITKKAKELFSFKTRFRLTQHVMVHKTAKYAV